MQLTTGWGGGIYLADRPEDMTRSAKSNETPTSAPPAEKRKERGTGAGEEEKGGEHGVEKSQDSSANGTETGGREGDRKEMVGVKGSVGQKESGHAAQPKEGTEKEKGDASSEREFVFQLPSARAMRTSSSMSDLRKGFRCVCAL